MATKQWRSPSTSTPISSTFNTNIRAASSVELMCDICCFDMCHNLIISSSTWSIVFNFQFDSYFHFVDFLFILFFCMFVFIIVMAGSWNLFVAGWDTLLQYWLFPWYGWRKIVTTKWWCHHAFTSSTIMYCSIRIEVSHLEEVGSSRLRDTQWPS